VSTKRKATKRRDIDAVRVYPDGRLAYWTMGKAGAGSRKFERRGSLAAAEERADELRRRFQSRQFGAAPKLDASLDTMVQAMLDHLRDIDVPGGTPRQYKSDWNCWVPQAIGEASCRDAGLWHWSEIFNGLNRAKASESRVLAVARTLGSVVSFGIENGYFVGDEGFASSPLRAKVTKKARLRAAARDAEVAHLITLGVCPTVADVDKFAAAFEVEYPGYGARLVWLAFATGLRICELLARRWDSIDLLTGAVAVDNQLDRYRPWPAVRPPKGGKTRTAQLWTCYLDVAESLVADALAREGEDHGWLFPRHRSTTGWADQAGKLAGAAVAASDWDWTFHWLRHGYASWSLAPQSCGGFGLDLAAVSGWLGHHKTSTTQNTYVQPPANALDIAREATTKLPGTRLIGLDDSAG
jgi:integrase